MAEIIVPDTIRVLMPNGRVSVMKLETYLAGSVAMAIGATAPLEALKAQAVASRTYAAHAKRHAEQYADVCTHAHCQKWKRVDPIVAPEVFRAVSETWGTVALYNGQLIEAFFFENCSGRTRDAEEMAMPAQPYLRGTDCPCGFTEMKGHGVGMCQRGAIVLARQGASFKDILRRYYRDVEVVQTRTDVPTFAPEETEVRKHRATPRAKTPKVLPPPADGFSALLDSLNQAIGIAPATPAPIPAKPKIAMDKPLPAPERSPSEPAPASPAPAQPIPPLAVPEPTTISAPEPVAAPPAVIHVDNLPGPRLIAGCLARAGVPVEIEDARGWKMTVFTGSAPHYGEGGFEIAVSEDGFYTINVEGKVIEVSLREETVFLRGEA